MFDSRKIASLLITACLPVMAFASTAEQLENAAAAGNVSFVLVTDVGAGAVDPAKQMIEDAMAQFPRSVMIEMNRAEAVDSVFVREYGLGSAPVPLILVFAPNGAMGGGSSASQLSVRKLVAMVPSPRKAEVLKAIQAGQAVYVTASRSGMNSVADVVKGCAEACDRMQGKCATVAVDMDDPAEAEFLKLLSVNLQATEPVTVVLNSQGQTTATYTGQVEVAGLVKAANKKISSGCCPPSSGKTCPPPPKKKEGK